MKTYKLKIKYLVLISIFCFLLSPLLNFAQTAPELVVSWKANSYASPDYEGRILPSSGSVVNLALLLVDNGKVADLSEKEVRWYLNNNLYRSGIGLINLDFTVPLITQQQIVFRTDVIGYRDIEEVTTFTTIPVATPQVVIDQAQLPLLKALFYFFNISALNELVVDWVDNNSMTTVMVRNINNPLEFAKASVIKEL